jgi:hypothetical protein
MKHAGWPDKQRVVSALLEQIEGELVGVTKIAHEAANAATHEENRAEGDKDMRATEASYVARGQASRVEELEHTVLLLRNLPLKQFAATTPIEASAMVELTRAGKSSIYMLLPGAGGRRITIDGITVQMLAPSSPLGSALLGMVEGDEVELESAGDNREFEITRVN